MGTTPTTVNNTANDINSVLKTVVDLGLNTAKAAAITAEPWLGLPVISEVFSFFMGKISGYISDALIDYATFTTIDIQTGSELSAFNAAATNLKAAQSQGDPNAISTAQDAFKRTLASLVHFDGSST